MRKSILKISFIICIVIFVLLLSNTISNAAASFDASISKTSVKVGDTVTLTIKANNAAGNYSVSTSNANITLTNGNAEEFLDNSSTTLTYKAVTAGTVDIVAKATDMTDLDNSSVPVTGSKTFTITISELSSGNNGGTTVEPTPDPEPTPEPTPDPEPTFTAVNETVYAKSKVNVREGYSTSDKIIGSLNENESVTRIGIGSNGWSKVTYEGKTAYISSAYLTTEKPAEKPAEKSNNTNLKSLTIEGQELIPSFNKATLSYTMQVKNDITKLNVKAEAEDEKATVTISGNEELKEGENVVTISVSAEDGTIKIYEIKVTRLAETIALGLQSLKIEGTDIETKFKPDVYNYEIYIKEVTQLKIEAVANDEKANIEIIGNENLQEGENIITIIISSQDSEETITYQIKANKLAIVTDTTATTNKIDPKIYLYCGIGAILLIALIIVIIYTIKHRNQEEYEEYMDKYEGFPDELPEVENTFIRKPHKVEEKVEDEEIEEDVEETENVNEIEQYDEEESQNEETKTDLDYFLNPEDDDDERPRHRRGKHF